MRAALKTCCGVLLGLGLVLPLWSWQVARAEPPGDGNGVMGFLSGEGGDAVLGATLYDQRCAACHDHATGRTPPKASIADNTRVFIANTLTSGIMRPMAQGLSPKEINSIAAYLSKRTGGAVGSVGSEAPRCMDKPPPINLATTRQWNGWGRDAEQSRYQPNPGLSAADVPRLKLKWAFAYSNSRNGQATVIGDRLFLNASSGAIYALDARTGCAYWRFDAPAVSRGSIIVGPLSSAPSGHALYFTDFTRSAYALDADSGALIWKTQVDQQHEVQMTGSPALSGGRLYVPISSAEEAIADDDTYECCKFRGAVAAVDAATGRLLWKTYVTPEPARPFKKNAKGVQMYGPAGGAIWSAPTVDTKRHLIYVATGDSYTDLDFPNADAIMALDERTGAIRWSNQLTHGDTYIIGCYGPPKTWRANCPTKPGPDHDFGVSPILHTQPDGRQMLLVAQKSSQVYALDPDANGKLIWTQRLGPGGPLGGVEFGIAADAGTLYVPVSDIYVAKNANPSLSALRIADGQVLWTQRLPQLPCAWKNPYCWPGVSQAISAMPGAVFAASMDGRFRAFDTGTGRILWTYDTAAPVTTVSGRVAKGGVMDAAGPTIAGGSVFVNSGYQSRSGEPGTVLMAFSVDGK